MVTDLAMKVTYSALARLSHPDITRQDMEDMAQEAALVLWQCRDRHRIYAFVSARRAAIRWFIRYHMGWTRHDQPRPTPQGGALEWPERYNPPNPQKEVERTGLPDEVIEELVAIFLKMGKTSRERTLRSAQRNAQAIALSFLGHTPEGIAQEMGLATRTVKNYLTRARRTLWEYAYEHGHLDDQPEKERHHYQMSTLGGTDRYIHRS
jgi:DNA-directed RNA polymerase specialized sigma24 family protein